MKTKKELQEEYKQIKPRMGVFQVKNEANGKILIDGYRDLNAIWNRTKLQLNFGNHPNKQLQSDWNEFGESQFTFNILSEIKQDEEVVKDYSKEIKELTEMFIEEWQPFGEKGYNKQK